MSRWLPHHLDTYGYLADGELSRYCSQVSRPDQNFSNPAAASRPWRAFSN